MPKLVRDRIPEIIKNSGKTPEIKRVSGQELKDALKDKLMEEAAELKQTGDVASELIDVLEVVDAIIETYGIDRDTLKEMKDRKRAERGGFREGYYLKE